ncbi:MAG: hypothetical protein ACRC5H_00315, partial [Treponemataceae bacterium]
MKKLLFLVIIIIIVFFFGSCKTSIIPGEDTIAIKNIYIEYFLIADSYADLKKYDLAAKYYLMAARYPLYQVQAAYKAAQMFVLDAKWVEALSLYDRLL